MHISKIQLENIKSHVSSTFEFTRGTTAITGENGAGKTTIIEAVAWALFDLLEYKKEDFVRRGAKKGSVTVTFESGLDEREYVVHRDTGAGYHVIDPRLQTRVADKKEEVFRFLWQHLGLEPGTDLKSLFKQAIGVPQGTFTAIFLEGATERKTAFDRLLKVEEYRQAAEKLRETARFIDGRISAVRENIARAEGELLRSESIEEEYRTITEQADKFTKELDKIRADLGESQQRVKALDEREREIASLRTTFEQFTAEKEKSEIVVKQLDDAVKRASEAKSKAEGAQAYYHRHLEVLGRLRELERERQERDRLRKQLAEIESAIANIKADQKRVAQDLAAVQNARTEIETLRPQVAEQEKLEKEIADLRERAASAKALDEQIKSYTVRLARLRQDYKANSDRLKEIEAKSAAAAELTALEKRDAELTRGIAALYASLERDERFQNEIKNGLCPILSERCLNLKEGQTLEAFVTSQFAELRIQIKGAESEHNVLTADLKRARDGARYAAAVAELRTRERELSDEGHRLRQEEAEARSKRESVADAGDLLAAAEVVLKQLDDPRGRIRYLTKEVGREADLRQAQSDVEANLERLVSDSRIMVEQMEAYRDLDTTWSALSEEREATVEPHRTYLSNEAEASALSVRQEKYDQAKADLDTFVLKTSEAKSAHSLAAAGYDAGLHQTERERLRDTEKLEAHARASLESARARSEQLSKELAHFIEIRRSMRSEHKEKERFEVVAETTAFIRDTLKEAAPRVARNYVYHVSIEAAQLYREITGNAECTLKWAEDYSILLEEEGYERPFASLSGGEQMAAALSVRLALLKQLTDIRIAFFDEPTTNMDAERRENLALQISRISHFDQLFVISHDETFDNFVDSAISLNR